MRVAHVDIGGCEGCSLAFLRAVPMLSGRHEVMSGYLGRLEIGEVDVLFVSGAVCLQDKHAVEALRGLREKAGVLVAFGSCAALGGILRFARGGQEPRPEHMTFLPLNAVVRVDLSIPGCPPPPQAVVSVVTAISLKNERLLAPFRALAKVRRLSGFDLIDDVVLAGLCVGCGVCELSCPTGAIKLIDKKPDLIPERCIRCGTCYVRCPQGMRLLARRAES